MCGIVGYIGKNTEKILIERLKRLEYRGYDSSGIVVSNGKDFRLFRSKGEIKELEKKVEITKDSNKGIAHTRWATHGAPDEINAHPHCSDDKKWFVVHNGIIENYSLLKSELIRKGNNFYSQTDTEIVAKLLAVNGEGVVSLEKTLKALKGSFALTILNTSDNRLYFAKNKSPLYLASYGKTVMVASDVMCFCGYSDSYYKLEDGEYGYSDGENTVFIKNGKPLRKNLIPLTVSNYCEDCCNQHYMLKEIYQTKETLKNLYNYYSNEQNFALLKGLKKRIERVHIIGCGTAYNAGLMGAEFIRKYADIDCCAIVASEYRYNPLKTDSKTLVIFISQSGETADTLSAFELAKSMGAITLAVVNVEHSALAKSCDIVMPTKAGVEIAVASTKAYSAQIAVLYLISMQLGGNRNAVEEIKNLANEIDIDETSYEKQIADFFKDQDKLFMIGRGTDYYTALEAGLKIKETCYINCDVYYAGELKHGFLALVEQGVTVIVFATDQKLLQKTLLNAEETLARGARAILFTCCDIDESVCNKFFKVIKVKKTNSPLQKIVNIIPWQLIAYYTSIGKGINPDKPRNLAKSVTVE